MSELPQNPERSQKARVAIAEYQSLSPRLYPRHLDDLLDVWLESCKDVALPPDEMRQHAWMHVERAMAAGANGVKVEGFDEDDPESVAMAIETSREFKVSHMSEAERMLAEVIESGHLDDAARVEATHELHSVSMLKAFWGRDKSGLAKAAFAYKNSLVDVLESSIARYKADGGLAAYANIHATVTATLVMDHTLKLIPLPAPPRMKGYAIDAKYRSDLLFNYGNSLTRFAVTDKTDDWQLYAAPHLLRGKKGGLSSNIAFAEALVKDKRKAVASRRFEDGQMVRTNSGNPAITEVGAALVAHLMRQIEEPSESDISPEQPHENPFVWYETLGAGRHPYIANARMLDQALSEIQLAMAEGALERDAAMMGGWMYVEAGMGRAMMPVANALSPHGDMDAAEDMFIHAFERSEAGTMDRYDTLLAQAAMPMYRAIATGENPPFGDYAELLGVLGEKLVDFYAAQKDKTAPEAVRADQMIQVVTACLLTATDPTRSFVVVPSSPRQGEVWQLATWEVTIDGFVPRSAGRIIVAEQGVADHEVGATVLTPKTMGQQQAAKRTETLRQLIQHAKNIPATPRQLQERLRIIEKARKETVKPIVAALN